MTTRLAILAFLIGILGGIIGSVMLYQARTALDQAEQVDLIVVDCGQGARL